MFGNNGAVKETSIAEVIRGKVGGILNIKDPRKLEFEKVDDLVDYVTQGPTPPQKNFDLLIKSVENSDQDNVNVEIKISPDIFNNTIEKEIVTKVLTRAHENRIKARNKKIKYILVGITAGMIIGIGAIIFGKRNDNDCNYDDYDAGYDDGYADGWLAEYTNNMNKLAEENSDISVKVF